MSKLQKDYSYEIVHGDLGQIIHPAIPGIPAQDGYWSTEIVSQGTWSTYIPPPAAAERPVRFATHDELRTIWPWIVGDCAMQIKILTGIRTSYLIGNSLGILQGNSAGKTQYIAITEIAYAGSSGIAYCVVTGNPATAEMFVNPQYQAGWVYHSGDIPDC